MHSYTLASIALKIFTLYVRLPRDDEQLAYSKHVEGIVKNKTQKVHLVGSII